MGNAKFSDDFKRGAVDQIVDCGYRAAEVARRPGVSVLYAWMKKFANEHPRIWMITLP